MSAIIFKKLFEPTSLTSAAAQLLYTVESPSANLLRNHAVRISNNTSSTRLVDVYAVPDGGSASTSNAVVFSKAVGPNDYIDIEIPDLKFDDEVRAKVDTTADVVAHSLTGNLYAP